MKKLQLLLLMGFILSVFFILNSVTAANTVGMNYPNTTAVTRIGGTINLNASLDTNSANVTNITFYRRANSHSGAWTAIGSVVNTSAQQTLNWVLSFNTATVIDDRNHEFNATGYNITNGAITSAVASNISIDNGVPTVTFSSTSLANNENRQPGQTFAIAIDADSTIGIINCTIAFTAPGATNVILTASANACSDTALTSTNFTLPNGVFTYTITAYDDNGNGTASSSRQLSIAGGGGGGSTSGGASPRSTPPSTTPPSTTPSGSGSIGEKISSLFDAIGNFFRKLFNRD